MKEKVCVYDIILDGEIVYVGQSKDPTNRLIVHKDKGKVPRRAKLRIYKWYDTRHAAMVAEGVRQRS